MTPVTSPKCVLYLKNKTPSTITKMDIKALSIPAIELSRCTSAMGNKNMGIKLPTTAVKNNQ